MKDNITLAHEALNISSDIPLGDESNWHMQRAIALALIEIAKQLKGMNNG